MGNLSNLKPFQKGRSREEAAAAGAKGGKASGEARRRKAELKKIAKDVLYMPLKTGDLDEITAFAEAKGANLTVGEAAILSVANRALKGDYSALAFLRDTAGEKPVEKVDIGADVDRASEEISAMIAAKKAKEHGE